MLESNSLILGTKDSTEQVYTISQIKINSAISDSVAFHWFQKQSGEFEPDKCVYKNYSGNIFITKKINNNIIN